MSAAEREFSAAAAQYVRVLVRERIEAEARRFALAGLAAPDVLGEARRFAAALDDVTASWRLVSVPDATGSDRERQGATRGAEPGPCVHDHGVIPFHPNATSRADEAAAGLGRIQAAAVLGVSVRHVDRLVATGELPSTKSRGRRLFRRADVVAYLGGAS